MYRFITIVAFVAAVCGCAVPHKVEYRAIVLTPQDGLIALREDRGATKASQTNRSSYPLKYRLDGEGFKLQIACGEKWYPRLYIEGVDEFGNPIALVSANVVEATKAGEPTPAIVRGESYRYFVRSNTFESGEPLLMDCYNDSGKLLGKVKLTYGMTTTTDIEWEGP